MIIRGVFSMSIINRLKSLFKGDNEESGINTDVSNTSDDVQVTSSKNVSVTVSDEEKETEPLEEEVSVDSEDSTEDLTSEEDIEPSKDQVEETTEEVLETSDDSSEEIVEEVEVAEEVSVEAETVEDEEIEEDVEEVEQDLKNKDTERDKMTLLTDKELLNDSNRDPDFTAEFIDAGIETVKHCFQCGTCSGSCPSGRRTPTK